MLKVSKENSIVRMRRISDSAYKLDVEQYIVNVFEYYGGYFK